MNAFMESVKKRREERRRMFKLIKNTSYDFHKPVAKEVVRNRERCITKGNKVGKTSFKMGRRLTREEYKSTRKSDLNLGRQTCQ